jgi:hypothetical protein
MKNKERIMKTYIKTALISIFFFLTVSGFAITTNAEVGTNNLFCPAVPYSEGMLNLQITALGTNPATFSAGMIGVFKGIGNAVGGLDWMTTQGASVSGATPAPTNEIGSQLITWWSRVDNRNTQIQITNHATDTGSMTSRGLNIHVRIFASDCTEIRDFCDTFTPSDTHLYDLSNLVTNTGADIAERNLANKEGILVVTPVNECSGGGSSDEQAIDHNFLSGNVYISDTLGTSGTPRGYAYGTNMYARRAICNAPRCSGLLNGSTNARFDTILPRLVFGLFNTDTPSAGADAVVMNYFDDYGPPYLPRMTNSRYSVSIFDNNEIEQSCGEIEACFLRLGIDSSLPARQDVGPPITGP